MDPETHEIFYEKSVHFEQTCPSLASSTSPSSSFVDNDHSNDSDSEDEIPPTLTRRTPPSQGQKIVEDITSSSSTKPCWAQQTLDVAGSLVGNPSDTQRTRSQHKSFPHAYIAIASDPLSFKEASGIPEWDKAMEEEYNSLMKNNTWSLVPLPKGRKVVRCKWIYRTKFVADGSVDKHKARLVAKGFSQVPGIDYIETFALVAKMNSIRLTLAIEAAQGWVVHEMDVKSTFLNGDLHEEIYMEQPQGFVQGSTMVCRLKKSIYGLKQTPQAWYAKMDSFLLSEGFTRCHSGSNVYILQKDDSHLILVLYVDELIITGSTSSIIACVKTSLQDRFAMIDLGLLHYFLGIEITQSSEGISLSQPKYALDLLSRFHMSDCKPTPTPFLSGVKLETKCTTPLVYATLYKQLVGSLIYLTHTRPNIAFAVGMVSRFMQEPHELHWKAAKHILHYIKGTHTHGIHYAIGTGFSWLDTQTQTMQGTQILASPLQGTYFTLASARFVGKVRSKIMLLFLPQRLSIKELSMQLQRLFGYSTSSRSLDLIYLSL